jgi:hypothetical protein
MNVACKQHILIYIYEEILKIKKGETFVSPPKVAPEGIL